MTLAEMLVDAEASYHALMTGKSVREYVDQNGEKVSYTVANAGLLALYIQGLKNQIATAAGCTVNVGPMRVFC
jgi:hypothetical protein